MLFNRRELLIGAAVAAAPQLTAATETFSFVHLTDTHIEPELHAPEGCRMAFDRVNKLRPDFIIHGGDLVFEEAYTLRQNSDGDQTTFAKNHGFLGFENVREVEEFLRRTFFEVDPRDL